MLAPVSDQLPPTSADPKPLVAVRENESEAMVVAAGAVTVTGLDVELFHILTFT